MGDDGGRETARRRSERNADSWGSSKEERHVDGRRDVVGVDEL